MVCGGRPEHPAHVTTATSSPFSYSYDPSGVELRRALRTAPVQGVHLDRASLTLAVGGASTLLLGLLRLVVT